MVPQLVRVACLKEACMHISRALGMDAVEQGSTDSDTYNTKATKLTISGGVINYIDDRSHARSSDNMSGSSYLAS